MLSEVARSKEGMSVERLTSRLEGRFPSYPHGMLPETIERLTAIEDILGDNYDLDRLRELVEADQAIGREIFLPNDKVRGTVEGFRAWKDGSISFMLVEGRHRYSLSSDLVYKFLVGRKADEQ